MPESPSSPGPDKPPPSLPEAALAVPPASRASARRWGLIRDVLVFQCKLLLDGVMDVLLGPVGLVAAIIELIRDEDRAEPLFYEVLRTGRRFDRWINLFGAVESHGSSARFGGRDDVDGASFGAESDTVDDCVARIEEVLRARHGRGGVTQATKEAIDRALDAIQSSGRTGRDRRDQAP